MKKLIILLFVFLCYFGMSQTSPTYQNITIRDQATIRQKAYFIPTVSAPAIAHEGMLYADTDHHLYYYDGTSWVTAMSNWTLTGNDIENNNSGTTTIGGGLLLPALTPEARLGYVLGHEPTDGNTFPVLISDLADSLAISGGGVWGKDATKIYNLSPTFNVNSGTNTIDPVVTYSVAIGNGNIIDSIQQRGMTATHAQAFGLGTEAYNLYAHAQGTGSVADGQISHAEGNNCMATTNDGHAEGNRTVSGRRRYEITSHGVKTLNGVNKAYVMIPDAYGNQEAYFPNKLTDSITTKYGAGVKLDSHGNVYPSGLDSAVWNVDGTLNTANGLTFAMHSYMVVKGVNEGDMGFFRILKAEYSTGNGTEVFYDRSTEPYGDIQSVYSSYAPTVYVNGVQGGNGGHAEGFMTSTYGYGAHAEGMYSKAWNIATHAGGQSKATGIYSFSHGLESLSSGIYSTTFGVYDTASASYSFAAGLNTNAETYCGVTFGRFNVGGGDLDDWQAGDYLFELGNGANAGAKSNAFAVYKNGNTFVGKNLYVTDTTKLMGKTGFGTATPEYTAHFAGSTMLDTLLFHYFTNTSQYINSSATTVAIACSTTLVQKVGSTYRTQLTANGFSPYANHGTNLGQSNARWAGLWSQGIRDSSNYFKSYGNQNFFQNNVLVGGTEKSAAYMLEVSGTGYFLDDLTVNDTINFTGSGNIRTTGNGALNLNTGTGAVVTTGSATIGTFLQLTPTSDPPGSPAAGMIYYDTEDNKIYYYDGSAWQSIAIN